MENDASYLAKLQDYYADHSVLPPYSTIMLLLGFKSKSPVAALIARLKLLGFLESTPEKRLKPGKRFFERPISTACVPVLPVRRETRAMTHSPSTSIWSVIHPAPCW